MFVWKSPSVVEKRWEAFQASQLYPSSSFFAIGFKSGVDYIKRVSEVIYIESFTYAQENKQNKKVSLIFITYFPQLCVLPIIYARASYLANDLPTDTATYTNICLYRYTYTFTVVPSMFNHHVSSSHHPLCYQQVLRVNVRTQAQAVTKKNYTIP